MIRRDAQVIGHVSPYKRIDPMHPERKNVITRVEYERIGGREPDPALYTFSYILDAWLLKGGT